MKTDGESVQVVPGTVRRDDGDERRKKKKDLQTDGRGVGEGKDEQDRQSVGEYIKRRKKGKKE